MSYKIYAAWVQVHGMVPNNTELNIIECSVDFEKSGHDDFSDHSLIKLRGVIDNVDIPIVNFEVKHPVNQPLTHDNWLYFVGFNLNPSLHENERVYQNSDTELTIDKILGRTVIQMTNKKESIVVVIEPDHIPTDTPKVILETGIMVVDHEYGDLVDNFDYSVDLEGIYITPIKDKTPVTDLPVYQIPLHQEKSIRHIFGLYMSARIILNLIPDKPTDPAPTNDPNILIKKFIGGFCYLESNDKKIRVASCHKSIIPIEAQLCVLEKIRDSTLNVDEQRVMNDIFYQQLKVVSKEKSPGNVIIIKAAIRANDILEEMIR